MRPYTIPRYTISLVKERNPLHGVTPHLSHSRDSANTLRPIFDSLDREQFVLLCLDAKCKPIGVNVVSIGSLSMSIVHPREVFKSAILLNAAAVIASHNHPSGDTTPSPEDIALTERLKHAGEILGIRLLDHIILAEDLNGNLVHYSFADEGRI